ncbi:hypothetical protein [Halarchaeum salinum]|uniref:Uncharacterized protein n=1 Tax=Halarchaeum salinum TaxID=489912 RepID=A0AAV3S7E8_9EURY
MKRTSRRLIRRTVRRIIGIGYYAFGIIVSLVATGIHRLWLQITLVFAGVVFAGGAYYFDSLRRQRRVTDDKLEPLLDGVLFPLILDEYRGMVEDPPEIRVNLMLLRYRDVTPVGQERNLWPWQRSMAADFTYGAPLNADALCGLYR